MAENAQVLMETLFNVFYLMAVWGLVVAMLKRRALIAPDEQGEALWIMLAFAFLALGDTGHVGFRVIAYAQGGLETTISIFGSQMYLVALGSVATAWTFTVFYVCMLFMWKERYSKKMETAAWLVVACAVIRSVIMILPGNEWNSLLSPRPIAIARNTPLLLMQLGMIYLILRDARPAHDGTFTWIGIMIILSFVCFAPVVLLVHSYPTLGMLMIPKTIAYLAIAVIGFKGLYARKEAAVPA